MNFNNLLFYFFLSVVLVFRYALPWSVGRWMLVAASYAFYGMANPWYCILLLTSTVVDYVVALRMPHSTAGRKKHLLLVSIIVNISLLGVFKYSGFAVENINFMTSLIGGSPFPVPELLLPVGISFYTFQTLSYTIDVYRGKVAPEKDFGAFALYVAYFPQLVAGPIERAGSLLPQLKKKMPVTLEDFEEGFQRILWGLTKKLVFADRLGLMVDQVYASPSEHSALVLFVSSLCFSFQIYLDFSAYTDIALGSARLMGVRLRENFRWPFLAKNHSEFWSRWHMSLTSWFRDYVLEPLGGTRRSRPIRSMFNVLVLMFFIGLWHGASWNFVIAFTASGLIMAIHQYLRIFSGRKSRGPLFGNKPWSRPLAVLATFTGANILLIFFRNENLGNVWSIIKGIVLNGPGWSSMYNVQIALLVFIIGMHVYRGFFMKDLKRIALAPPLRAAFWFAMFMMILYGSVDQTERFIYFQF
ncbi:MAG: MBOAT family protein [Thermodesulfovibrionales bacterium]|nr:MBOAT family protein [Thermodesulfovibrionales bacterium]